MKKNNMNAREMLLDFVETFGILLISVFIFYFVVVENYFGLAERMVKFAMVLAVFSLPLIISSRINQKKIRFYHHRNTLDKIIAYASPSDVILDRFVIIIVVFFVFTLPLFYNIFEFEDFIQGIISFILLFFWHIYFFKKHLGFGQEIIITRKTELLDRIYTKALPVIILIVVLINGSFDEIDIIQSAIMFFIVFIWRWYFYKQTKI
jgi:hypothetical protein